jgi:hypothetical protein
MSPYTLYSFLWNLVSVLAVVVYGMLAVWAAYSPWHWFWRVAVVGASLGALVALPENKSLYPCAVAIVVIACVLTFLRFAESRSDTSFRCRLPRIGLRDMLLLTVILAAILAVVVNAPTKTPRAWAVTIVDGLVLASMAGACAWLALSRTNRWIRLAVAPLVGAYCFFATRVWLLWFNSTFASGATQGRTFSRNLQLRWETFVRHIWPQSGEWIAPIAIGVVAYVVWLIVARKAGWFAAQKPSNGANIATMGNMELGHRAWRYATVAMAIAIALFPTYTWLRIVRPRPLPPEAFLANDNYQELVRLAGELFTASNGDIVSWSPGATDAQIAALVTRDEPKWQQVRELATRDIQFPWLIEPQETKEKLNFLCYLLVARVERGDGTGTLPPRIAACLDLIRLGQMQWRAGGTFDGDFVYNQSNAEKVLWSLRSQLSPEYCRQILNVLGAVERDREPWESFPIRDRQLTENASWYGRLERLLADFAGIPESNFAQNRYSALFTQILAAELAIQVFEQENGRLPTSLDELVPEVLQAAPGDPFADAPLRYRLQDDGYLIYSVGPNGVDDHGEAKQNDWNQQIGDFTRDMVFPPPRPAPTKPTSDNKANVNTNKAAKSSAGK